MEVRASLKGFRVSAFKARLVADQVRGKGVEEALNILSLSTKKSAAAIEKLLRSAVANAEYHNDEKGAGIDVSGTIRDEAALTEVLPVIHGTDGPVFYAVKVSTDMPGTVYPPLDGPFAKDRFRLAVLGKDAV